MLKIKDNVDLKELKKLGLRLVKHLWFGEVPDNYYHYIGDGIVEINIEENSRHIDIIGNGSRDCDPDCVDVIFDLFQAGLVEKVKE